ncbi:MAG: transcription termination/antitermination protein NusG [Gammaproteobacteria bacterium]|nr:transcription termination/antitermination protein NusG [Gammaproteobacteria bacterium]
MNEALPELKWYVIQSIAGSEKTAVEHLKKAIEFYELEDSFGQILVPTEEVIEMKKGQRKKSERRFYPGYILAQVRMTTNIWHIVRKLPKVMGFVGGKSGEPTALSEQEAARILSRVKEVTDKPRPKVLYEVGEVVRIKEGPFTDFTGAVDHIDYDKNRLQVAVVIFGRSTPVELDFIQVEKSS